MSEVKDNVEVELRVVGIQGAELKRFVGYCEQNGTPTVEEDRLIIDYSTFLEGLRNRTKDIRIRSTNGQIELIVKLGSFADASREETSILINSKTLQPVLSAMAIMGYEKGVLALRHIKRYVVGDFEVAIQAVMNLSKPDEVYSTMIEVEQMSTPTAKQSAESQIAKWMSERGLRPVTAEEWYGYVEDLNKSANGVFEYKKADWQLLESLKR